MKTNYRKLHRNLKYILPLKCEDLIRLGNKSDSGYIVSKSAIKNSNTMISLGMANNWSFENEFLKINQKNCVYIYDHTVDLSYFFLNLFIRAHANRKVNASPQRQGSPNLGVIRFMTTQIG